MQRTMTVPQTQGTSACQPVPTAIQKTESPCMKQPEVSQTMGKGADCMKTDSAAALARKKQTLVAWTKILLREGEIDQGKYNRMVALIEKLTA